jgi:hypothetical protein
LIVRLIGVKSVALFSTERAILLIGTHSRYTGGEAKLKMIVFIGVDGIGWGGRIRTSVWRNQNPLPYRLATPQSSDSEDRWGRTILATSLARKREAAFFVPSPKNHSRAWRKLTKRGKW